MEWLIEFSCNWNEEILPEGMTYVVAETLTFKIKTIKEVIDYYDPEKNYTDGSCIYEYNNELYKVGFTDSFNGREVHYVSKLDPDEFYNQNRSLNEWSELAYNASVKKGFYENYEGTSEQIAQSLMLIVSELAEALEADRKNNYADLDLLKDFNDFESTIKNTFEDEIADAIIRLFDLCGAMDIDLDKHVQLKMKYNSLRPHKHGKKY